MDITLPGVKTRRTTSASKVVKPAGEEVSKSDKQGRAERNVLRREQLNAKTNVRYICWMKAIAQYPPSNRLSPYLERKNAVLSFIRRMTYALRPGTNPIWLGKNCRSLPHSSQEIIFLSSYRVTSSNEVNGVLYVLHLPCIQWMIILYPMRRKE